jgi:predicted TIM-barrel fold metal-dependent hydrolase
MAWGKITMKQNITLSIEKNLIKKAKEIARDMNEKANKEALERVKKEWYKNAYNLAGFFAIPHNQTKKELTDILYKHQDFKMGEIEAILKKDEVKDLDYYEKDRALMLMFSDMLVDGLVKQFPNRFRE